MRSQGRRGAGRLDELVGELLVEEVADEPAGRGPDQGEVEEGLARRRVVAAGAILEPDGELAVAGEDEHPHPRRDNRDALDAAGHHNSSEFRVPSKEQSGVRDRGPGKGRPPGPIRTRNSELGTASAL